MRVRRPVNSFIMIFTFIVCGAFYVNAQEEVSFPEDIPPEIQELIEQEQMAQPQMGEEIPFAGSPEEDLGQEDSGPSSVKVKEKKGGKPGYLDLLDLKRVEVDDVLKLISQKSGINIIASQSVKGKVTVYLRDVTVEDALKIIVEAYGWAYIKDGDIIKVMTDKEFEASYGRKFGAGHETRIKQLLFAQTASMITLLNEVKSPSGKVIADEKSGTLILIDDPDRLGRMEEIISRIDVPIKTEVFKLSYAKAEELAGKITEMLTPGLGFVKTDERSNRLVVSDTAVKLKDIRQVVEAFDEKDKAVLIEAKILQILLSDSYKLGVDWEGLANRYHDLQLVSDFDILGETEKRGKVKIGTLDSDRYTAVIEALGEVGITDVLSSPRIAAVNNKEAKILIGSTEPYVTATTTTPASGPTTTAESVNFIEVGIKLYVTPTIHNDGFITMKIKPEVSTKVDTLQTTNSTIPIVETSEAETTVIVKDGVTIVIGGLIKEEKIKSQKKVPFIGDIPLLGMAFKSESDSVRKNEIVIFLTPKIITGDVEEQVEVDTFHLTQNE